MILLQPYEGFWSTMKLATRQAEASGSVGQVCACALKLHAQHFIRVQTRLMVA